MSNERGYIELDRRFRELDPNKKTEDAALDSYTAISLGFDSGLGWENLLERRLVVVLGEPGSGKTWEFQERAKILGSEGKAAFFIRLDRLAAAPLESVLGIDDAQKLRTWLRGPNSGFFFLDSVDEAKFRGLADFETALDRFKEGVGARGISLAQIFISSRISDWRPQSDAFELRTRFPNPPKVSATASFVDLSDSELDESPLVVQLVPLDRTRVERFARARGVIDVKGFSYGSIRFHHRRIAEYLAAQWIAKRMREACPITELENLLVAQVGSRPLIRPALAPVVAWLSYGEEDWSNEIRHWVLEAAPGLHLRYGDPSRLPLEYKRRLLRTLVERYSGRERIWVDADPDALSRLADPQLADDVSAIILNHQAPEDLRTTMLQLVRHGRLLGCLDSVRR
jgi:hypothetical protein